MNIPIDYGENSTNHALLDSLKRLSDTIPSQDDAGFLTSELKYKEIWDTSSMIDKDRLVERE